ncbi:MAG: AmmeMemoRadiSam system radical SAM enzyme [Candidatus Omnitrophica bacterium]|nr:AmmeMemoRadiSam system radical SAM enzyme [Candidatus Omnitrophota bacterium]
MIKEAMLYEKLEDGKVQCRLCSHYCEILPDKFGFCGVRKNSNGRLFTHVYGEVIALHVDPIEKKPLYHFFPGSNAYSIATVGCNFRCSFCQNWQISQVSKRGEELSGHELKPEEVVREAKKNKCKSISYTYTEPTIFFEYAYETAKLAKTEGLYNNFVTNGYMTETALDTIRPYLDACNVDLKSFSEDYYKKMCHAHLKPVLNSIKTMKKLGIWVEITTLIIPGQNDSDEELKRIADFIIGVAPEIPWHISRFHPDYKYTESGPTPVETLKRAKGIGEEMGLRYIYLGNVLEGNNTYCYNCKELLIERIIFDVSRYNIKDGKCAKCNATIDGVFS